MLALRDMASSKNGDLSDYIEGDTAGRLLRWGWDATIGIHRHIKVRRLTSIAIIGHAGFADIIAAFLFPEHAEELSKMLLHKSGGCCRYTRRSIVKQLVMLLLCKRRQIQTSRRFYCI